MLVNCNSCKKKFTVPDSAIIKSGRLLQCGSCGNKWTQYPNEEKIIEKINRTESNRIKEPTDVNKIKNLTTKKKKKREIDLYSKEYIKKKYGLIIKDPINNKKIKKDKNIGPGFSFYSYLVVISIFLVAFFGILNLTKDILISNYPFTEYYIIYFYEIFDFMKIIIVNLVN